MIRSRKRCASNVRPGLDSTRLACVPLAPRALGLAACLGSPAALKLPRAECVLGEDARPCARDVRRSCTLSNPRRPAPDACCVFVTIGLLALPVSRKDHPTTTATRAPRVRQQFHAWSDVTRGKKLKSARRGYLGVHLAPRSRSPLIAVVRRRRRSSVARTLTLIHAAFKDVFSHRY